MNRSMTNGNCQCGSRNVKSWVNGRDGNTHFHKTLDQACISTATLRTLGDEFWLPLHERARSAQIKGYTA